MLLTVEIRKLSFEEVQDLRSACQEGEAELVVRAKVESVDTFGDTATIHCGNTVARVVGPSGSPRVGLVSDSPPLSQWSFSSDSSAGRTDSSGLTLPSRPPQVGALRLPAGSVPPSLANADALLRDRAPQSDASGDRGARS